MYNYDLDNKFKNKKDCREGARTYVSTPPPLLATVVRYIGINFR